MYIILCHTDNLCCLHTQCILHNDFVLIVRRDDIMNL